VRLEVLVVLRLVALPLLVLRRRRPGMASPSSGAP
jgi:hypothetical protein